MIIVWSPLTEYAIKCRQTVGRIKKQGLGTHTNLYLSLFFLGFSFICDTSYGKISRLIGIQATDH